MSSLTITWTAFNSFMFPSYFKDIKLYPEHFSISDKYVCLVDIYVKHPNNTEDFFISIENRGGQISWGLIDSLYEQYI